VLGPLNGTLTPKVLFIGEAPGRRGAERTRRPFSGDQSGRRFDELLAHAGLTRDEIFITNAVLCCPANEERNQTPTAGEIANCSTFLRRTLDLLCPPVVATVGAIALRAVGNLVQQRFELSEAAGTVIPLENFLLVPLYHPSPRVLHTVRNLAQQRRDMRALKRALRSVNRQDAKPLRRTAVSILGALALLSLGGF